MIPGIPGFVIHIDGICANALCEALARGLHLGPVNSPWCETPLFF
jgi:hypothetical protein